MHDKYIVHTSVAWEFYRGSIDLSDQNLKKIGPKVHELWSDFQTNRDYTTFIHAIIYDKWICGGTKIYVNIFLWFTLFYLYNKVLRSFKNHLQLVSLYNNIGKLFYPAQFDITDGFSLK